MRALATLVVVDSIPHFLDEEGLVAVIIEDLQIICKGENIVLDDLYSDEALALWGSRQYKHVMIR